MADDDLEFNNSIVNLDGLVSPIVLAGIIGCNVSLVYQESQAGRLPSVLIESTYRECLQQYIKHFKKSQDLRLEKAKIDKELKIIKMEEDRKFKETKLSNSPTRGGQYGEEGENMPPLMAAKFKQDIRVNIARETQLWIKTSIERGEYISLPVLVELAEPFIMSIRQCLLSISLGSDEAEKQVDLAMETLHTLGTKLVDGAKHDSSKFIDAIMAKDIIPEEIEIDNEPPRLL